MLPIKGTRTMCTETTCTSLLESNDLFGDFQSACRKFHSCETAITKITNDILLSLDQNECSFLLFLDLSSAFDTIDHNILLSTLQEKYGITGVVLKWFQSYLSYRRYKVKICKCYSKGIECIAKFYGFKVHAYAYGTQLYISFVQYDVL